MKGVLINSTQILDLLKHQPKGRLPIRRLKSSIKKSSLKSKNRDEQTISNRGHKCGLCGKNGHYRSTCPKN